MNAQDRAGMLEAMKEAEKAFAEGEVVSQHPHCILVPGVSDLAELVPQLS